MANFPIPSDPVQKDKIMAVIREVSGSFTRIEAERDYVKEAIGVLAKDQQIPKKLLNQFAKAYYRSNFAEVVGGNEEFEELTMALQPKAIADDFESQNGNLEHE